MKRAIVLLLPLLMVLSLAACGNQTDSVGKLDEDKYQTEETNQTESADSAQLQNATGAAEETEQTEESESAQIAETEFPETEPAFDNSWADNDYEKQIPEIPFENWSVGEAHDENAYLIKAEDVLYTDVKEYGELLTDCAFTQNLWVADDSEGIEYRLSADSESGYSIRYDFNAYSYDKPITGLLYITIYDNRIESDTVNGASWGDEDLDAIFPALPDGTWEGDIYEDDWRKSAGKTCNTLTEEAFQAYVETLKAAGFTDEMDEDPQDHFCRFSASKTNNKLHISICADDNGDGTLQAEAFAVINKQ